MHLEFPVALVRGSADSPARLQSHSIARSAGVHAIELRAAICGPERVFSSRRDSRPEQFFFFTLHVRAPASHFADRVCANQVRHRSGKTTNPDADLS